MIKFREYSILRKYDIISFDVFDTLIERSVVKPSDIFMLVGKQMLGQLAEQFYIDRIVAEKAARNNAKNGEVTIEDIYAFLKAKYGNMTTDLMKEEVRLEIESCYPKKGIAEFYKKCISEGKKVFLISDMYLPKKVIISMLKKCGIEGYHMIFISNEYSENKTSGQLFQVVKKKGNLNTLNWIHIGDSFKGDLLGARKAGIKSILIQRKNRIKRLR